MQSTWNERQLCERYREVRMRLRAPPMKAPKATVMIEAPPIASEAPPPEPIPQVPLPVPDDEGPIIKRLTLARILNTVSAYYGVEVIHIISARRTADIMRPRHVAAYLARENTTLSYPHIGRLMGGRDHSTILVACRKIARLLSEGDEQLASDLRALRQELGI